MLRWLNLLSQPWSNLQMMAPLRRIIAHGCVLAVAMN